MTDLSKCKVLVALDQAATTGYAIGCRLGANDVAATWAQSVPSSQALYAGSEWGWVGYGTCSLTLAAVETVLETALMLAGGDPKRLLVMLEDHSAVPARRGRSSGTVLGIGAARGYWMHALDVARVPKTNRFKTTPREWRTVVLGGRVARMRSEPAKAAAVQWARALTGSDDVCSDSAEALAILAATPRVLEARARPAANVQASDAFMKVFGMKRVRRGKKVV